MTTAFVKQTERVGTLSIALDRVTHLLVSQTMPFYKQTNPVVPLSPAIDKVTSAIVAHLDRLVSPSNGSVPATILLDPLTTTPESPWSAIGGLTDGSIAPFRRGGHESGPRLQQAGLHWQPNAAASYRTSRDPTSFLA